MSHEAGTTRAIAVPVPDGVDEETAQAVTALYTDGIIGRRAAFSRQWAQEMADDIDVAFAEARSRPNGAVGRGPKRYYVEIHPEQMRGWLELVDHPWVRNVCTAVLGPQYQLIELGFDVPGPGAMNQPWHRDFPMPEETRVNTRLTSLAFNLTAVDTEEDMGPFEIALGSQWDLPDGFDHEMSPRSRRTRGTRRWPSASTRRWATSRRGRP